MSGVKFKISAVSCTLLFLFVIMGSIAFSADEIQVSSDVDKRKAAVGDPIQLTVTVLISAQDQNSNTESLNRITFPSENLDLSPFSLLNKQFDAGKDEAGNYIERMIVNVSIYETGDFEIPGITLQIHGADGSVTERKTEPQPIQVKSVLTEENTAPCDIHSPLMPGARWQYVIRFWAIVLGVILAIAAIFFLISRIRRKSKIVQPVIVPPRPAHEVANERFTELENAAYLERRDFRAFFIDLTEIVKEYLGSRYTFPAPESTTEEVNRYLDHIKLESPIRIQVIEILQSSDLVKFAKFVPEPAVCKSCLNRARELVEKTADRIQGVSQ